MRALGLVAFATVVVFVGIVFTAAGVTVLEWAGDTARGGFISALRFMSGLLGGLALTFIGVVLIVTGVVFPIHLATSE